MSESEDSEISNELSLDDVDSNRDPEERERDGKSGEIPYLLKYDRDKNVKIVEGKIIEIGELANSEHMDLQPLSKKGYTHYGIFRLKDRSTTTLVQDKNDVPC